MRRLATAIAFFCFTPFAGAQTLCDISDPLRIEEIALGTWIGSSNRALESETVSRLATKLPAHIDIARRATTLTIRTDFLESLRTEPFELKPSTTLYDDEQIEELLDGTSNEQANDKLVERTCSAYGLPQFTAELPVTEGMSASGAVTIIFYDEDLALQLSDLTLQSPETVIYATESAWLTRSESETPKRLAQ